MKKLAICLALLGLLAFGGQANAIIGTVDDVPAATLLLPYFEVDLDNVNGVQTLFSINNASATAILAHIVVWSDLSVPVLDFNIYLTGYDVVTINLRDIFVLGALPRTASDGQDPTDTISHQGIFSQDINFASCNGFLPPPTLPDDFILHLQNSLTGQASNILLVGGNPGCAGQRLNDRIARGYITVDTVNACNLDFPFTPGYFVNGGAGTATNQNVLWGDYFYVNSGQNFAQGETLVHVEAAPGTGTVGGGTYPINPETTTPGEYTFYGRYVAWSAADNREPLATNFAVRFINGGIFSGGTSILSWRDSKVNQGAFTCPAVAGVRPAWYPLGQEQIVIFDEEENPEVSEHAAGFAAASGHFADPLPGRGQPHAGRRSGSAGDAELRLAVPQPEPVERGRRRQPAGGSAGCPGLGDGCDGCRGPVQRRLRRHPARQRHQRQSHPDRRLSRFLPGDRTPSGPPFSLQFV